jgi:hypothetical protein
MEALLTDNSKHISSSIIIPLDKLKTFFDSHILPLLNTRFYDDDYSSIVLITNNMRYAYKYTGCDQWSLTIEPEFTPLTLDTQTSLKWDDLVYQWEYLLRFQYKHYKWIFSNIDKAQFTPLELVFGQSMYIPFATNEISLIIKSKLKVPIH